MDGTCSQHWRDEKCLLTKYEPETALDAAWEHNINIGLKEMDVTIWIGFMWLGQVLVTAAVNTAVNSEVLYNIDCFVSFCTTVS